MSDFLSKLESASIDILETLENAIEKASNSGKLSGGGWITINGKHVYIGSNGKVQAGAVYGKNGEKITSGEKIYSSEKNNSGSGEDKESKESDKSSKVEKPKKIKNQSAGSSDKEGEDSSSCKDNPDAQSYFQSYESMMGSLSGEQLSALSEYRNGDYKSVKSLLRSSGSSNQTKLIDSSFEKVKAPSPTSSFKGLSDSSFFEVVDEGSIFTDKAYVSVTINSDSQDKFYENDGYSVEVKIPKGSSVIPFQNIGSSDIHDDECELLLPRDSKFKVLKKIGKNLIVELI